MQVSEILIKIKLSMKSGNYDMVPTAKNRNSKRKYGLSQYDIEDYIASLEKKDLYKGPEPDLDFPGEELFIFKKEIKPNVIFYTKLKYKNNQIKILSCHEDEK
ncbi:MAG: hypothetical protein ACI4XR_00305 [Bacilli bacterium]